MEERLRQDIGSGSAGIDRSFYLTRKIEVYAEVERVERLSGGMVRVVLAGGELHDFVSTPFTDEYINAYFVSPEAPYEVPFELEEARALGPDHEPKPRRLTVRHWDEEKRRLTLDFFTHGDQGHAGVWAQQARPGDRLQFKGPNGSYSPDPDKDWHFLAGDESTLPAISASVEAMPEGKPCVVFLVVDGPEYELEIDSQAALQLIWLHRSKVQDPEKVLLEAIREFEFPTGSYDVFVHGEAAEVRGIRKHLILDRGIEKAGSSISPYWRRDHTDEEWRRVKKQWLADQQKDA